MTKQVTIQEALSEAKKEVDSGNFQIALEIYSAILQNNPSNGIAIKELSKLLENLQNNKTNQQQPKEPSENQLKELKKLFNLGEFFQLEKLCQKLLKQFSNSIHLNNILGIVYLKQNRYDEAIIYFNKTIEINPKNADPYNNKALIYKEIANYQEALANYNKAIELNPNHFDAYNNRGNIFKKIEKYEEALADYMRAIKLNPHYTKAYYNIGDFFKDITLSEYDPEIVKILIDLLEKKTFVKPIEIVKNAITLIKSDSTENKLVKMPLLLKLMEVCQIADLELENFLSQMRANILFSLSSNSESTDLLQFQEALALQCFINEYIYNVSQEEIHALAKLEKKIESDLLQDRQPRIVELLCFASYKNLHEYEWCEKLILPQRLENIFKRFILDTKEEKRLQSMVSVLKKISDTTSIKVQHQYEQNPYPRWENIRLKLEPISIGRVVQMNNLKLVDKAIEQIKAPNILVAGCGTGQQSIDIATTYKNSRVLAVDLSLASLAYAKRKTKELGITNIEYMQADILDLRKLDKQFDLIDCGGVLHHMKDPMAGWKVLTSCLRSGGLMRVGLYSKLAREDINRVREEILEQKIGTDRESIKFFREKLKNSSELHHKKVFLSNDAYSLSEFRDLLFHVQEHQFTLEQISKCLDELGLKFCGFRQNNAVNKAFNLKYPKIDAWYELDKWDSFEKENPHIFGGMYQFWCQKLV